MAFVDWRASFSVSDPELDSHHQRLFSLLNRLHEEILAQRGRVEMDAIIAELLDYTRYHFSAEERLMEACGFPAYEEHRREHETLLARVRVMEAQLQNSPEDRREAVPQALAFLLKDWLMNHILVMDKAFAPYVAGTHRS